MRISYFTKFLAKAGAGDELFSFLSNIAEAMGGYAGCSEYSVFKVVNEPDAVCVFETWTDTADHDASLKDPAVLEKIKEGMALIEKVERQDVLSK